MNLAVVILNWNQAAATIRCVEAVAGWTLVAPDIWVVDNASQDGSRDLIPKQCPAAHVLASDSNLGFAGGNNLALRRILASRADVVLMLNNDAVIAEDQVQQRPYQRGDGACDQGEPEQQRRGAVSDSLRAGQGVLRFGNQPLDAFIARLEGGGPARARKPKRR